VARVHAAITAFMVERLGMLPVAAEALRARYREELGTTLNGLMRDHAVSPDEYLAYVHAVEIEELLAPDAAFARDAARAAAPEDHLHERVVAHAERVLACLGVRECFAEVYSLERVAYVPKPERAAFESVAARARRAGAALPRRRRRVDNLRTAGSLGMRTVLVGDGRGHERIDVAVPSIMDLPRALRAIEALP